MYWFVIPLVLGFALGGASAFTAAFSRRWGARGGQMATAILRNLLGIPLRAAGYVLAWRAPALLLFAPGRAVQAVAWLLRHPIYGGGLLVFAGLALLRPSSPVLVASAVGFVWAIMQARLSPRRPRTT